MTCSLCLFLATGPEANAVNTNLNCYEQLSTCLQHMMKLTDSHRELIVETLYPSTEFGRGKERDLLTLREENQRIARRMR